MDGPSSRFPSASVASSTNLDPGTSFSSTPRQSLRELFSSVGSIPTKGIDPPRPAKEGYEWVWFPAGYWAEREIAETPTKESTKSFRWRKRSGKSSSGSPKDSPRTAPTLAKNTEASLGDSAGGRPATRTPASSESSGSFFPLNRPPDAPLPSPYLTEEAHVQSLQWPSIEAAVRKSSISSMFRSRVALSPSPLHLSSAEDELELDRISPSTVGKQGAEGQSSDTINTELLTPMAAAGQEVKPKKSFINWRMLSDRRQRLRRSQALSDENMGGDMVHIQPPRLQGSTASPLRKSSTVSEKSRKSLKGISTKLLTKARWHRKISSSSAASTSSLQTSVRSRSLTPTPASERGETAALTNAWASEYPGGEAIRVQTPRIVQNFYDQFPRSFFSDLSPPLSTPHRPLSRQEGQVNLKKTNLSTSFTPGDSSTSFTPHTDTERNEDPNAGDSDTKSVIRDSSRRTPRAKKKDPAHKEWWEVSVPTSYAALDQRSFKFDLPEHFPSSPMCPANKRHKSGGTGVCVYHGRAKGWAALAVSVGESPKGGARNDGKRANGYIDRQQEACGEDDAARGDVWK
ncbi:hypothetical protein E0Z10_g2903 [Xylaria hypoxylon]|uniref:Uncharacterized protein n=1 Tax=Xylaria hypoxylon TaxID=37992 RepID=A0A4Z0YPF4_9PEZI|nr:hypothetical protein E0Z10_g2903 [Xylaria hypoxylon]